MHSLKQGCSKYPVILQYISLSGSGATPFHIYLQKQAFRSSSLKQLIFHFYLFFFGCCIIKNNGTKKIMVFGIFFLLYFSSYSLICYHYSLSQKQKSFYFTPLFYFTPTKKCYVNRKHFFAQRLFVVIHAKFPREWLRSTKTGARERSIAKSYFISGANSLLKLIKYFSSLCTFITLPTILNVLFTKNLN